MNRTRGIGRRRQDLQLQEMLVIICGNWPRATGTLPGAAQVISLMLIQQSMAEKVQNRP